MSITDARGITITPNCVVAYFKSGRYSERLVAKVIEVRKKVKISEIDHLYGNSYEREHAPRWVEGSSCLVIEKLPYHPKRLNT